MCLKFAGRLGAPHDVLLSFSNWEMVLVGTAWLLQSHHGERSHLEMDPMAISESIALTFVP